MEINRRAVRQKLAIFKVISDLFIFCFYFIQQQKYKLYYVTLMSISEIQSKRALWSCYSSKFKVPADFSHHAILRLSTTFREINFRGKSILRTFRNNIANSNVRNDIEITCKKHALQRDINN